MKSFQQFIEENLPYIKNNDIDYGMALSKDMGEEKGSASHIISPIMDKLKSQIAYLKIASSYLTGADVTGNISHPAKIFRLMSPTPPEGHGYTWQNNRILKQMFAMSQFGKNAWGNLAEFMTYKQNPDFIQNAISQLDSISSIKLLNDPNEKLMKQLNAFQYFCQKAVANLETAYNLVKTNAVSPQDGTEPKPSFSNSKDYWYA